jgi:hypothetical protein
MLLAAGAAVVAMGTPASAAQHPNGYIYVHWNWSGSSFWNVDQDVVIRQKATASFWPMLWTWTGATYGGYLGVQTNGGRGDGTTGDTAVFSLWNATAASGPLCTAFGGEGSGYSCRAAYPIVAGRMYRYRLWRMETDAAGQWWGGWVKDQATGIETYLGKIRVARSLTSATGVQNFSEYFGQQTPCTSVPQSVADFTQPAANQQSPGVYQYGSTYRSFTKGSCTDGGVTVADYGWTKAARVTLGG